MTRTPSSLTPSGTLTLGATGETIAAAYLTGLGWTILDRNWRCSEGELDIVAIDGAGAVVFVEVKCRAGLGYGHPLDAITWQKQVKLRQLAAVWLATHRDRPRSRVRVDAIGVLAPRGKAPTVTHVEGIA